MITAAVVDTHTAVWYLLDSRRLPTSVVSLLDEAAAEGHPVFLASISVVEVIYLVEKGRLPEIASERLNEALEGPAPGFTLVPLDLAVAHALSRIPRQTIPDMPDRIIAATAVHLSLPLITRDSRIRASGIETIW